MEPLAKDAAERPRGINRRDLLKTAITFCALPAAAPPPARSLITVWLAGGPSQLETWDPHPGQKISAGTRAIGTQISGVRICSDYPQVAEQLHRMSVVRSLVSKDLDHERATYHVKTGQRMQGPLRHPSLGAVLAKLLSKPPAQLPPHVSLGPAQWPSRGGFLGAPLDAFRIAAPGESMGNLRARARGDERQKRRLEGLSLLSSGFAEGRSQASQTFHEDTVERALRLMASEHIQAFSLDDEPSASRAAYGESTFSDGCLIARRLIERGVTAVEVTLDGFDSHADNHETHRAQAGVLDPALASLIRDLHERGLLRTTTVLCMGEFGRTPQINALSGRDHWGGGFSCLIGGAGVRPGRVIGQTDPYGRSRLPKDPISVPQLIATVLSAMGVDPARKLVSPSGRPIKLSDAPPVRELLA